MKIVFFGTSDVGLPILESLRANHEVVHIVTSPDSPVGRKQEMTATPISHYAEEHGIPTSKPNSVRNNPEFLDFLRQESADIFVVVSYGKIMPQELLDIAPLKTVNLHFSLLPKYRGAAPIQYALLNGDTETGTTFFILDALVDHGPILGQQSFPIEPDDTFATLAPKLADFSSQLITEVLAQYEAGNITPEEQNHSQATLAPTISKDQGKVDWTKSAQEIYNQWRAFTPWPGIWTTYEGQTFKILKCAPITDAHLFENPTTEDKTVISCGKGTFLKLEEVQLSGKKAVSMTDFLNGHKEFSSTSLGNLGQ